MRMPDTLPLTMDPEAIKLLTNAGHLLITAFNPNAQQAFAKYKTTSVSGSVEIADTTYLVQARVHVPGVSTEHPLATGLTIKRSRHYYEKDNVSTYTNREHAITTSGPSEVFSAVVKECTRSEETAIENGTNIVTKHEQTQNTDFVISDLQDLRCHIASALALINL